MKLESSRQFLYSDKDRAKERGRESVCMCVIEWAKMNSMSAKDEYQYDYQMGCISRCLVYLLGIGRIWCVWLNSDHLLCQ